MKTLWQDFSKKELEAIIDDICDEHRCNEKQRKLHAYQYVQKHWHPHPSQEFIDWWQGHPHHCYDGVPARTAYNCECYRQEYNEAKRLHDGQAPAREPLPPIVISPEQRERNKRFLRELIEAVAGDFSAGGA